jgi:hypothetical protein
MPLPFTRRGIDPDAADFCSRSGASDRAAVSAFVRGVKDLGLYESMVCWPLRSSQNAGTGTTAYSLGGLGTFGGTLVNGPAWGANGIDNIDSLISTGHIRTSLNLNSAGFSNANATFASVIATASTSNFGAAMAVEEAGSFTQASGLIYTSSSNFAYYLLGQTGSTGSIGPVSLTGLHVVAANAANNRLFINGGLIATSTPSRASFANGPLYLLAGRTAGNAANYYLRGRSAFAAAWSKGLSASEVSNFYDLYKTTLGTGLGLP